MRINKKNAGLGRVPIALGGALCVCLSASASTWHISPAGRDTQDGSEKAPFATLSRAVEAAVKAGDACEIVLHAGTYRGDATLPAPVPAAPNPPAWVIRAASAAGGGFEEVLIDGGQKVTEATVVDAERGVYFFPFALANYEPSMWEADKRMRYPFVADRRAVEVFPGTLAPGRQAVDGDMKQGVFFRTSDSKPPAAHDLGLARDRKGFIILRPNVTVKGLRFRNFQLYLGVCGISIEAPNVTVDSCDAWNCWGGFMVGEGIPDAKILNCTARDVATGVKSYGKNTVIENCRFVRISDPFEVQEYEQDQCGIQFYSSNTQTARGNLCVGFQAGIFIKASGGVLILENNTVVAPAKGGDRGIGPNTWRPGSLCRGNVVVGYSEPIGLATLSKDCVVTGNLIWRANRKVLAETAEKIKAGTGGETVVAPPQFVDEGKEDYRLAPASAGATANLNKQPIGALGVAPQGAVAQTPPDARAEAPAQTAPTQAPRIVGQPVTRTNDYGAVVLFKTDLPCTSALQWGADKELDRRVEDPRNWPNEGPGTTPAVIPAAPHTDHCLAIIDPTAAGRTVEYQVVLNDTTAAHRGQLTLTGPTRTLHVATAGTDAEPRGAADQPFATLQFAVDRALPGDRVVVAPGIYPGSAWMTHGGIKDHPILIEAAESWDSASGGAVLDGKREAEYAIRLGRVARTPETRALGCLGPVQVAHVRIRGFEIRWYNGLCVRADEAQDITIEGCKFWSRHYVKGRPGICEGIGAYHCERVTIDHNLFFTLNTAVRFNQGVGLRLTNNTAAKCFHRVIGIIGAKDLYLRNNSFAFGSSYLLQIHAVDPKSLNSDYNNFAVHLREDGAGYKTAPAEERLKRENNDFYYGESKSLAAWDERTAEKPDPYLSTLTPWREATGQDKHSISAHPRYADPQNRDFRLLPNSPNIGKGENGADIGALGRVKE